MLHLPATVHLLDHEQRIHPHFDIVHAPPAGLLEAEDERGVLRDVVRGVSKRSRDLGDQVVVGGQQGCTGAARPGIPAGRAVRVQDRLHAEMSSAKRFRSTFPPDTMLTTRSPGRTLIFPARSAAVAAAPAGSATSFARSNRKRIPSAICSSVTRTTSSTRRPTMSKPRVPAIGPARPSAMVLICSSATGFPASSARRIVGAPSGSTPTIRIPFFLAAAATATPE